MQRMMNAKCTSVLNVDKEHFRTVKFIGSVWPAMKTSRDAGTWTTRGARKATRVLATSLKGEEERNNHPHNL
jgi:hypothetical protein